MPTPRKFSKSINNGNFLTWTGLNNPTLLKHPPPSIATTLGHIYPERKNLQSTKPDIKMISPEKSELEIEEDTSFFPIMDNEKTHKVCAAITPFDTNSKGFSDLIGALIHKSICGNLYVMDVYDFDSNTILTELIKTGKHRLSVMHLSKRTRY